MVVKILVYYNFRLNLPILLQHLIPYMQLRYFELLNCDSDQIA